jgi:chromosome segregation ATPase
LQAEFARGRDRLTHLNERLENSTQLGSELEGRAQRLRDEEQGLELRHEKLQANESALSGEAKAQGELLALLLSEEAATAAQAQRLRRSTSDVNSRIAGDDVRLGAIRDRRESARQRLTMLGSKSEELAARLQSLREAEAETQPRVERAEAQKQTLAQSQVELKSTLGALTPELSESERARTVARRELEARRSRLQVLEELERRLEVV